MLNSHKVCFVMCVNDEQYMQESLRYISEVNVPEGYEIEVLTVTDAVSMAAGYNEAMNASDAKYKIYLHQDVFIINRNIIKDIIKIFENSEIGMLGVIGIEKMPASGIMWEGSRVGNLYTVLLNETNHLVLQKDEAYTEVEAIDGLLMITQYDLPWREDVFKDWDFYDASQCREFINSGYKVAVPYMNQPWCIHDDKLLDLEKYDWNREIFLNTYKNGKSF